MEDRRRYVRQKRLEHEANRGTAEADEWARRQLARLDDNKVAKFLIGNLAGNFGAAAGVGRGVYNDGKAIKDGAVYLYDLASFGSPRQEAAIAAGRQALAGAANYVSTRARDRSLLRRDVKSTAGRMNRDLNQYATPQAPTLAAEIARRYNIGVEQGEAAYNVASLALPVAGEVRGAMQLGRIGAMSKRGPAKYIARGVSPQLAEYFAQPYQGMGAHAVPRRTRLPGGGRIPKVLMDGPFNVLKPKRVERGVMLERHFKTDGRYYGGPIPAEFGGGGWSGRRLGWERYNPLERVWHGTPGPTKAVVVGGPAALGAVGGSAAADKRRR